MSSENSADEHILSILGLADRMIAASDRGFMACTDDGCLLLNGLLRECAYRLRDAAEREQGIHGTKRIGADGSQP